MKINKINVSAICLVFTMLQQLVFCNTLVFASEENIIYNEDFSSGSIDSEWNCYYKNGTTVFGSVSASDKSLNMIYTSKGSTRGLYATRTIDGLSVDSAVISFDFISGGTTQKLVKSIVLCSDRQSSSVTLDSRNISVFSDSIHLLLYNSKFYYLDGGSSVFKQLPGVSFKSNTRYYYKAVIDNINNTYSLYISEYEITDSTAPVISDVPVAFSTETPPDILRFQFQKFESELHSPLIIDNIKVQVLSDSIYNKLDFENELKDIAPYLQEGNFEAVDEMLLEHYRQKTSPISDEVSGKASVTACELYKDFFMYDGVSYLGRMNFSDKYGNSDINLTGTVNKAEIYSFELVADNIASPVIEIYSKDGSNNVVLSVTADGRAMSFYPTDDTYISYDNKNMSHGSEDRMYIAERPGDDTILGTGTMRGYIKFDLSSLAGKTITSAELTLRGRTPLGSSSANASVWLLSDNVWSEDSLSWSNTVQSVLCFNGLDMIPFNKLTAEKLANDRIGVVGTWERMYWMTTLANAFRRNGTEEYAKVAIDILMSFIDHQFDTDFAGNSGLSTAIRARELAKCHHHLAKSVHMTPKKNIRYLEYMYALGKFLEDDANFRPNHNWGTFQILGLNHTASYFTEFTRSALWKRLAIDRTGMLLSNIIASDGSYVEGSSHYAYEALTQIMKVINNVEAAGNTLSAEVRENLKRCTEYALNISFPNGYDIAYGDGGYNKINISSAVNYLADDELSYIYTGGISGKKPGYTSKIYPDGRNKMAVLRSGFESDALSMYINNGAANRLSHTHPDDLAVIAYAYQNPVLIDPGSYSYDVTEPCEWQRHTTEAHNTVTIDSSAQSHSDGTINDWSTTSAFDYYEGVSGAYSGFSHNRRVYFIKDKLWIVADNITSDDSAAHTYEQNWHFPTDAAPKINNDTKAVTTNAEGKANISVVQLDGENVSVSLKKGWYTDEAGDLCKGDFASYKKSSESGAEFLTLLYPHPANDTKSISVLPLETSSCDVKAYTISDGETADTVIINNSNREASVGDISFGGEFLYLRRGADGAVKSFSVLNATSLSVGGITAFNAEKPEKNLTVSVSDGVMEIASENEAVLDTADIFFGGTLDKLIINEEETQFGIICNKVVPGRIFEWDLNGTKNSALKEGSLSLTADAYGFDDENTRLLVGLFDSEGRLLSALMGDYKDGKYVASCNVGETADKAVFILLDIKTLTPLTPAGEAKKEL